MGQITDTEKTGRKCCANGPRVWCIKYFWEGQLTKNSDTEEPIDTKAFKLTPKQRKIIAFLLPGLVFHFIWWGIMIYNNWWYLFVDKYPMTITMIFGGLIAGMTSEGGGAVAFPVMTLGLGLAPSIARDFSLMIQATGMSGASFAINFMKIRVEKSALVFCTLGGIAGLIFGFHVIDPNLSAGQKKMYFVSIWFSFAFALFLLNWHHKRRTFVEIPNMCAWKYAVLALTGFVGGCFTSFAGSGLDICSFSILCLLFRVSEKVATPTSVILMAATSAIGVLWRGLVMQEIETETWEYLMVCGCIVIFGAPTGAFLGSHFHRLVLASFVYIIDVAALIGGFAIVPQTPLLAGVSCGIIVVFFFFFLTITKIGQVLMNKQTLTEKKYISNEGEVKNGGPVVNGYAASKGETNMHNLENGTLAATPESNGHANGHTNFAHEA